MKGAAMAHSTCARCGGGTFEVKTIKAGNYNYAVHVLQCASCGAVAGVVDMDAYNRIGNVEQMLIQVIKLLRQP